MHTISHVSLFFFEFFFLKNQAVRNPSEEKFHKINMYSQSLLLLDFVD